MLDETVYLHYLPNRVLPLERRRPADRGAQVEHAMRPPLRHHQHVPRPLQTHQRQTQLSDDGRACEAMGEEVGRSPVCSGARPGTPGRWCSRHPAASAASTPERIAKRSSTEYHRQGVEARSHGERRREEGPELSSVDQLVVRMPVKVQRRTWSQAATSTVSAPHHGMRTGCVGVGW